LSTRQLTEKGGSASLVAGLAGNGKNISVSVRLRAGFNKMQLPIATLAYCCAALGFTQVAGAQTPIAIVEDVESKTAGIEFMDYLRTGQFIRLAQGDRLVIGYFDSCWREVIIGGTVLVGKEESEVTGGSVDRQKVRCDAGKKGATSKETTGSGAMVFRKTPSAAQSHATVFALSPVFVGSGAGSLVIERLDRTEPRIIIPVPQANASCGGFVDLAKSNVVLSAGGIYRAKAGARELTFKVDASAEIGSLSILSRLLRLPSPP
jgi:hypothetical protein